LTNGLNLYPKINIALVAILAQAAGDHPDWHPDLRRGLAQVGQLEPLLGGLLFENKPPIVLSQIV
jgi:hypothetical protein